MLSSIVLIAALFSNAWFVDDHLIASFTSDIVDKTCQKYIQSDKYIKNT